MCSFIGEEPSRFVKMADFEKIFSYSEVDIDALAKHFETILSRVGSKIFNGQICSRDRFLMFRGLVHGDVFGIPMCRHVQRCVENFHEFPALRNYRINPMNADNVQDSLDRAQVRDAAVVFTHVLAESLAQMSLGQEAIITDLAGELLETGRQSKLWLLLESFIERPDEFALSEVTYGVLFYLVVLQSTDEQWEMYYSWYTKLPEKLQQVISTIQEHYGQQKMTSSDRLLANAILKVAPLSIPTLKAFASFDELGKQDWFRWQVMMYDNENLFREPKSKSLNVPLTNTDHIDVYCKDKYKISVRKLPVFNDDYFKNLDALGEHVDIEAAKIELDDEILRLSLKANRESRCQMIGTFLDLGSFKEAATLLGQLIDEMELVIEIELKEQLQVMCGYAGLRSGDRDLMRKARQLLKTAKIHKPMVLLWMAELELEAYQFDAAKKSLESASFEIVVMPKTDLILCPANEKVFEEIRQAISAQLDNPPQPDHICCNANGCSKREIFEQSLDFAGLVRVFCEEECALTFHPECWKAVTGSLTGEKTKHGLGARCCTPDCQGRISLITMLNYKMDITKEYRWTGSARKNGLQEDDNANLGGQEPNGKLRACAIKTGISTATFRNEVDEALRCAVASTGNIMSVSELVALCEDLCGYEPDFLHSFVKDTLKCPNIATHSQWNRSQWLGATSKFLENLDPKLWSDVNGSLTSVVICEPLSAEEIVCIDEEYARLEKEFEDSISEEILVRKQIGQKSLENSCEDECTELEREIEDLERQCELTESSQACTELLTRRLTLKQNLLVEIESRLEDSKDKLQELLVEEQEESALHALRVCDREELERTIKANATEARSRLIRVLMKLVEIRHELAIDIFESVEYATGTNLREVEHIRDRRVNGFNRTPKAEHFKLMKEMKERVKSLDNETGILVYRLRSGNVDPLEVVPGNSSELLGDFVARYMMLPPLYRRVQSVTLLDVAKSLPKPM